MALAVALTASAQRRYPILLDGEERADWNFTLTHNGLTLTGICVVRQLEAGLAGTIVNEFGVKVMDFTATGDRVKVSNVIGPMNRWYVRRVLRQDLRILVSPHERPLPRRHTIATYQSDSIILVNERRDITYRFQRIKSSTDEAASTNDRTPGCPIGPTRVSHRSDPGVPSVPPGCPFQNVKAMRPERADDVASSPRH